MRKGYQRILSAALITLGILCTIGNAKSLVSSNPIADLVLIKGKIIKVKYQGSTESPHDGLCPCSF